MHLYLCLFGSLCFFFLAIGIRDPEAEALNAAWVGKLRRWETAAKETGSRFVDKQVASTRTLASKTLRALEFIYGKKTFGVRLVWSSMLMSTVAFLVFVALCLGAFMGLGAWLSTYHPEAAAKTPAGTFGKMNAAYSRDILLLLWGALGCFSLAILPSLVTKPVSPLLSRKHVPALLAIILGANPGYALITSIYLFVIGPIVVGGQFIWISPLYVSIMVASLACDIAIISGTRALLRRVAGSNNHFSALLLLVLIAVPIYLVYMPVDLAIKIMKPIIGHPEAMPDIAHDGLGPRGFTIILLCMLVPTNGFGIFVSASLVATALLLIPHMVSWQLVSRSLYALHAKVPWRKACFTISALLLAAAPTSIWRVVQKFLGLV